jgi:hypothetical protein
MTELCTYLVEFDRVTISTKNVLNKIKFMTILNSYVFPHRGAILREFFRTEDCEPGVETCRRLIVVMNNCIFTEYICWLMISSSSIGTTTLGWVSACSTVVEHSQKEGFTECRCQRHVKPPTWRRTRDLERSNFRHKRPPASETTLMNPAVEVGTMGEKWPRILPKVTTGC